MGAIKIPAGKKLLLQADGSPVVDVPLTLDEPVTLNLASNWEPLMNKAAGAAKFLSVAGSLLRDVTGGKTGFSGQSPVFGYQVFVSGEPLTFNVTVTLHADKRNVNAKEQVLVPALLLAVMPLPQKSQSGLFLTPPGPSVAGLLKGLDLAENVASSLSTEEAGVTFGTNIQQKINNLAGKILSVQIGQFLRVPMVICTKAEPTFSIETDEDGYPMWAKVNMDIRSVEIAHRDMLKGSQ